MFSPNIKPVLSNTNSMKRFVEFKDFSEPIDCEDSPKILKKNSIAQG